MSSLTKKLVLSVLTLIITVGAFSATTFAWFTLGNTASTGNVTGDVTAGDGLEVSINNSTSWYTNIPVDVMQQAIIPTDSPIRFNAITSTNGITFVKPAILGGVGADETAPNSSYVSFTLKFRSLTAATVLLNSATLSSTGKTFVLDQGFIPSAANAVALLATQPHKFYAADALRVSFVDNTSVLVIENNARAYAAASGENVANHGNTSGQTISLTTGAHKYYLDKVGGTLNPTAIAPTRTLSQLGQSATENHVVTLTENEDTEMYEGSITVNVWIEGWDNEAFNGILQDNVNFAFSFTKRT